MQRFVASVKDDLTLELPQEAWRYVQPGQRIDIELPDSQSQVSQAFIRFSLLWRKSPRGMKADRTRMALGHWSSFAKPGMGRCTTMTPPSSLRQNAIVIDASFIIAIVSDEPGTASARAELATRTNAATILYASGVIVSEVLYVPCRKLESGLLTVSDHAQAIQDFRDFLNDVHPPPDAEFSLTIRAESIRAGYSCRRSADGLYIALAQELTVVSPPQATPL